MTGQEIINSVLSELDIKAPTLAEKIGVLYQRIFDLQKGKTKKVSSQLANAIIKVYPQFQLSWLLTGEGNMLTDAPSQTYHSNARPVDDLSYMNVPVIHIKAQCGYLAGYGDTEYIDTLPTMPVIVDKTYHGKYRIFEAEGDVIVHRTNGISIKQITAQDDKGNITCHSLNELFNDYTVNLDDVVEIYNVIKVVERNMRL